MEPKVVAATLDFSATVGNGSSRCTGYPVSCRGINMSYCPHPAIVLSRLLKTCVPSSCHIYRANNRSRHELVK